MQCGVCLSSGVTPQSGELIELGLNHEQQHQELILTDIKHGFFAQPLKPAYQEFRRTERSRALPEELALD